MTFADRMKVMELLKQSLNACYYKDTKEVSRLIGEVMKLVSSGN